MSPQVSARIAGRGQAAALASRGGKDVRGMSARDQPDQQRITAVDVAVFLGELVLLAVLVIAGARLGGSTALRIVLAVALPAAAAALWARWLAPRAARRLANPARLAAKIAVFAVASVLLAVAGLPIWAAVFFVASAALNAFAELSG
jgi:hypothetical protein